MKLDRAKGMEKVRKAVVLTSTSFSVNANGATNEIATVAESTMKEEGVSLGRAPVKGDLGLGS